jgi:hypothetical protein
VSHVLEPASSGRSKCRGCGALIARGELRFGERLPNPFAEGEMTVWFHPACAAWKRPEPFVEALEQTSENVSERGRLEAAARSSLAHRRLPRIDGAERAKSGQAKCRSCGEPIARGSWRIRLVFYQEGQFSAGGFVHLHCRKNYFETDDVMDQVFHFSRDLSADERQELQSAAVT